MALSTYAANVKFLHYCDSLDCEVATATLSGLQASYTRTNASTAPTATSATENYLAFDGASSGNGLKFVGGSGAIFNPGQGDFTVAFKARIADLNSYRTIATLWNGTNDIYAGVIHDESSSSAYMEFARWQSASSRVITNSTGYTKGVDIVVIFTRTGSTAKVYTAPTGTGAPSDATASDVYTSNYLDASVISLGARGAETAYHFQGRLYWFVVFNTCLSAGECTTDQWTKDGLKTAFTGASVTVTDAGDETFFDGESITITGTGFGSSQGNGKVYVSPTDSIANAAKITQTVTSWAATSITITALRHQLPFATTLYLFVADNADVSNATGYQVQFVKDPIAMKWRM